MNLNNSNIVGYHTLTVIINPDADSETITNIYTATQELRDEILRLDGQIARFGDDAEVLVKDIYGNSAVLTGRQIKMAWKSLDFFVTQTGYGSNRAGSVQPQDGGRISDYINYQAIAGYVALGTGDNFQNPTGLSYIILHELGHAVDQLINSSDPSRTATSIAYQDFRNKVNADGVGYSDNGQGSAQFQAGEAFANSYGRAIANYVGLDISMTIPPPYGYIEDNHL